MAEKVFQDIFGELHCDEELTVIRKRRLCKHRQKMKSILDKYDRDFPDADVLDLKSFEVTQDKGHLKTWIPEHPPGQDPWADGPSSSSRVPPVNGKMNVTSSVRAKQFDESSDDYDEEYEAETQGGKKSSLTEAIEQSFMVLRKELFDGGNIHVEYQNGEDDETLSYLSSASHEEDSLEEDSLEEDKSIEDLTDEESTVDYEPDMAASVSPKGMNKALEHTPLTMMKQTGPVSDKSTNQIQDDLEDEIKSDDEDEYMSPYREGHTARPLVENSPVLNHKSAHLSVNSNLDTDIKEESVQDHTQQQEWVHNELPASSVLRLPQRLPCITNSLQPPYTGEKGMDMVQNLRQGPVLLSDDNHKSPSSLNREQNVMMEDVDDMDVDLSVENSPDSLEKETRHEDTYDDLNHMHKSPDLCNRSDTRSYFELEATSKAQSKVAVPKPFNLKTIMSLFNTQQGNGTGPIHNQQSSPIRNCSETDKGASEKRSNQSSKENITSRAPVIRTRPSVHCDIMEQTYIVPGDKLDRLGLNRPCADLTSKKSSYDKTLQGLDSEIVDNLVTNKSMRKDNQFQCSNYCERGNCVCTPNKLTVNYQDKYPNCLNQNSPLPPKTSSELCPGKNTLTMPLNSAVKELSMLESQFCKSPQSSSYYQPEIIKPSRKVVSVRQVFENIKNSCPAKLAPFSPPKVQRLSNSKGDHVIQKTQSRYNVSQSVLPKILTHETKQDGPNTGTVEACVQTEEISRPLTMQKPAFRWLSLFSERQTELELGAQDKIVRHQGVHSSGSPKRTFIQAKRRLTPKKIPNNPTTRNFSKSKLESSDRPANARSVDAKFQFGLFAKRLPGYRESMPDESDSGLSTNVETSSSDGGESRNYPEDSSAYVGPINQKSHRESMFNSIVPNSLTITSMQEEAQFSGFSSGIFSGSSLSNGLGGVYSGTRSSKLSPKTSKRIGRVPDKPCQPIRNGRASQKKGPYPTSISNIVNASSSLKKSNRKHRVSACETQAQCSYQQAVTPSSGISKLSLRSPSSGQKLSCSTEAVSLSSKLASPSCSTRKSCATSTYSSHRNAQAMKNLSAGKKNIRQMSENRQVAKKTSLPNLRPSGGAVASSTPRRPSAALLDISTISAIGDTVLRETMDDTLAVPQNISEDNSDNSVEIVDGLSEALTHTSTKSTKPMYSRGLQLREKSIDVLTPLARNEEINTCHSRKTTLTGQPTGNRAVPSNKNMEVSSSAVGYTARKSGLETKNTEAHSKRMSRPVVRSQTNTRRLKKAEAVGEYSAEHEDSPNYGYVKTTRLNQVMKNLNGTSKLPLFLKKAPTPSGNTSKTASIGVPKASPMVSAVNCRPIKEYRKRTVKKLQYSSSSSPSSSPSPAPFSAPRQERSSITRGSSGLSVSPATRESDVDPYIIPSDSDETEWYQIYQELEEKTSRHRSRRRTPKKQTTKPAKTVGASPAVVNALKATEKLKASGTDSCSDLVTLRKEREQEKAGGLVACGLFVETPLSPVGKQPKTPQLNSKLGMRDCFYTRSCSLNKPLEGRPARLKHISKEKTFSSEEEVYNEEESFPNESTRPDGLRNLTRNSTSFCLGPDMCTKSFCFSCTAYEPV